MADNEMSLPYSLAPALSHQTHKYVSRALYELQNSFATPPLHTSATWKARVQVSLCLFFKVREVCSIGERGEIAFRENEHALIGSQLASSTASPLLSISHHPQPAQKMLLHSGYAQSVRRTPGGWGFTDYDDLHFIVPSDQNEMSFPCAPVLQRVALKLKIMGEKPHPPRPFLPCLNETSN